MNRILFLPESGSLAHVGRAIALAECLPATRFDVSLACHTRYRRLLPDRITWRPADGLTAEEFRSRLSRGEPLFSEELIHRCVGEDMRLFRDLQPDVVVGDFRVSLGISAARAGIPSVNVVNAHWSPWARVRYEVPGPLDAWWSRVWGPRLGKRLVDGLLPLGFRLQAGPFNNVRRRYGLGPVPDIRFAYTAGSAVVHPDLPELLPTPGAPLSHHYIGPVLWEPPLPTPSWFYSFLQDRPLVYVSVGSTGRWDVFMNVLRELETMNVITLAATSNRGAVASIPGKRYVADFLPGQAVCARADLVICNGGAGSVYQALRAGVPVIGIAANMDQALVMEPIARAGAGHRVLAGLCRHTPWRKMIDSLLNSGPARQSAKQLSRQIKAVEPQSRFLAFIQDFIKQQRPSPVHTDNFSKIQSTMPAPEVADHEHAGNPC